MRSVVVFLRDTVESAVTAYLDGAYPEQREPWVVFVAQAARGVVAVNGSSIG